MIFNPHNANISITDGVSGEFTSRLGRPLFESGFADVRPHEACCVERGSLNEDVSVVWCKGHTALPRLAADVFTGLSESEQEVDVGKSRIFCLFFLVY